MIEPLQELGTNPMARFPIDLESLPGLGENLARAVDDDTVRTAFKADPRTYLVDAGVDPKALAGLDLVVVEDTDTTLHFVIPAKIDSERVAKGDAEYLVDMGKSVALTCTYMIERRVLPLTRPEETATDFSKATGTDG